MNLKWKRWMLEPQQVLYRRRLQKRIEWDFSEVFSINRLEMRMKILKNLNLKIIRHSTLENCDGIFDLLGFSLTIALL